MAPSGQRLLDALSRMPFIDSAELSRVLGEAHATVHRVLTGLLADSIARRASHGTTHLPSSQRYYLTTQGIRQATVVFGFATPSDFVRAYPMSREWLALLIRRMDAVPAAYRLAASLSPGIDGLRSRVEFHAQQLQTYKAELPTLFSMNEALMVSDGTEARIGTLTSGREWFKPWRTVSGEGSADSHLTELQVMLEGVFEPSCFLSRLQDSANRLSRLQNSGILDSELSRLHSSGILDSLTQLQDSLVRSQMEAANTFSSAFSQITQGLARSFSLPNLFESPFTGLLRSLPPLVNPKARVAEELGWVVHRTLPTTVLEDASEDNLDEAIMTYYKGRWAEVRREIELATSGYLIDEDSKDTMSQILSAHEYGLYRLVPVAIMVEIERAVRVHLYGELVGRHLDIKGKIVDEIGELPISAFQDITSGIILHETLENHLYEHIDDDGDRSQFAENPIPNRHAAIHGLVPYSTEKSSLNSIFLADFVLQMITEMKREKIAEIADILRGWGSRSKISVDCASLSPGGGLCVHTLESLRFDSFSTTGPRSCSAAASNGSSGLWSAS